MLPKTIRKIAYKTGMSLDIVSLSFLPTGNAFFTLFLQKKKYKIFPFFYISRASQRFHKPRFLFEDTTGLSVSLLLNVSHGPKASEREKGKMVITRGN
jgi:hypothetical protein